VLSVEHDRLVGSLTLQVSFVEYYQFYRALLQKRPVILRSLLIVATPYHKVVTSYVQPIAFGVSFNLTLQSQSPWSLFKGMWEKRPRERDRRLRFENEEMTLQMQCCTRRIENL